VFLPTSSVPQEFETIEMRKIKITVPATIANLVCGFDVLGMAIDDPFDTMELERINEPVIRIRHTDGFGLSPDPERNVAGVALKALMEEYGQGVGFELTVNKSIRPGSGLGSSAAGAAGAVVGANHLLDDHFSKEDLVRFAMKGEELASGVQHADNVAPCIYGGIVLVRSVFPLDIIPLAIPHLYVTVIHPQLEIKTSDARQILRKEVLLKEAVRQWGNIAGLVAGFYRNDAALIGRSLEDVIIEPVRSILIPGFEETMKRSKTAGALGGGISGSGPSLFMLSEDAQTAKKVEEEMAAVFSALGIEYRTYVTGINPVGVRAVHSE
jgi:homoserine kinase